MTDSDPRVLARRLRTRLESDKLFGIDFTPRLSARKPVASACQAPAADKSADLMRFAAKTARCKDCPLHETRKNVVFGEGDPCSDLLFVGEAPGADEDAQGRPFVGRAGQLLTKIIEAMGFTREEVYIGNVLKCRPPGNRNPAPDEVASCFPKLKRQIELIDPKVVVALGNFAYRALANPAPGLGITSARGLFQEVDGRLLMPTFHPAYLLRNESEKRKVWEDMKKVLAELGRPVPGRGRPRAKSP